MNSVFILVTAAITSLRVAINAFTKTAGETYKRRWLVKKYACKRDSLPELNNARG